MNHAKVHGYVRMGLTHDPHLFSEAKHQIHRLWHLAIPPLLTQLESKDHGLYSFAAQCLIEMKNEKIIDIIISKSKNAREEKMKKRYNRILSMMKYEYRINVLHRTPLTKAEIDTIYKKKVIPFFTEINFNQS